jgi:methylthioribose-1-phosphate isomerase
VRRVGPQITAPAGSPVYNPAFDVTPAALITAIITERGVFRPSYSFGGPEMAPKPPGARGAPGDPSRPSTSH